VLLEHGVFDDLDVDCEPAAAGHDYVAAEAVLEDVSEQLDDLEVEDARGLLEVALHFEAGVPGLEADEGGLGVRDVVFLHGLDELLLGLLLVGLQSAVARCPVAEALELDVAAHEVAGLVALLDHLEHVVLALQVHVEHQVKTLERLVVHVLNALVDQRQGGVGRRVGFPDGGGGRKVQEHFEAGAHLKQHVFAFLVRTLLAHLQRETEVLFAPPGLEFECLAGLQADLFHGHVLVVSFVLTQRTDVLLLEVAFLEAGLLLVVERVEQQPMHAIESLAESLAEGVVHLRALRLLDQDPVAHVEETHVFLVQLVAQPHRS